jgi:hypothetical protein
MLKKCLRLSQGFGYLPISKTVFSNSVIENFQGRNELGWLTLATV